MKAADAIVAAHGGRESAPSQPLPNAALRSVIAEASNVAGVDPAAAGEQVIDTPNLLRSTLSVSGKQEQARGASAILQRLNITASQVLEQLGA